MELWTTVSRQRSYWHLEPRRRVPSDYEIGSSHLLYYRGRGFAVQTPVVDWYERFQAGSPLGMGDLEEFADPLQTTYSTYVARQAERESFVSSLLRSIEGTDYDRRLGRDWIECLERTLPVLRFPCHGMQMVAAYLAQLSPSGRVAILGLFQVGDEMRRIQRFAVRMHQLRASYPSFGDQSKREWCDAVAWQPLRRCIEQLLVSYDHGEAFVVLNLLLKPAFDRVFLEGLERAADAAGDLVLGKLLFSLGEDAAWHRSWARAFIDHVTAESPQNLACVCEWIEGWTGPVREGLAGLAELPLLHPALASAIELAVAELSAELSALGGSREPRAEGAVR